MISRIWLTIRGIRPSVGSSRRMIFGSSIMARAMASICCSPPDKVPPAWWRRSASTGKLAYDLLEERGPARLGHPAPVQARPEVLEHGQEAEDAAILRDPRDAEARAGGGRRAR